MAFYCLKNVLKYPTIFIYLRSSKSLRSFMNTQKYLVSSAQMLSSGNSTPIKFTRSRAAYMSISETTGLDDKKEMPFFQKIIILGSLLVGLVYFSVFREENDIDEILKGNPEYCEVGDTKLVKLKIMLAYCKKNNLPTAEIKAKIEEIESQKPLKPIFPK